MPRVLVHKSSPDKVPRGCQYPVRVDALAACFEALCVETECVGLYIYRFRGSGAQLNERAECFCLCDVSHLPDPPPLWEFSELPWDHLETVTLFEIQVWAFPHKVAQAVGLTPRTLPAALTRSLPTLADAVDRREWRRIDMHLDAANQKIDCHCLRPRPPREPKMTHLSSYRVADLSGMLP